MYYSALPIKFYFNKYNSYAFFSFRIITIELFLKPICIIHFYGSFILKLFVKFWILSFLRKNLLVHLFSA